MSHIKRIIAAALLGLVVTLGSGLAFEGVTLANHPPGPPDKVTICHNGKVTLKLSHQAAAKHLAKHDGDTSGACAADG